MTTSDLSGQQAGAAEAVGETQSNGLARLAEGNARFLDGIAASPDPAGLAAALVAADPYAIVLGCSDSRVPPELIFDEGAGRLFVVRVASNVAGQSEIGSIEYAIARWNCPLLLVLGHTQCGGVAAAMDRLPAGADAVPADPGAVNLGPLLSSIKFNVGRASTTAPDPWLDAVKLNVQGTVEALQLWSPMIRELVKLRRLAIVGAIYHVETGAVEFLEPAG